jgi:hypothetical protein
MKYTATLACLSVSLLASSLPRPADAASNFGSTGLGSAPYVSSEQEVAPHSADTLGDALMNSTPFIEMRNRYEYVDQSNLPHESHANTLRTLGGFQTDAFHDFRIALAGENVLPFGSDNNYNNGVNSLTYHPKIGTNSLGKYPKIGDPAESNLQLANLQWYGLPQTSVTAGRQYLVIDNQRWIGTSNWRQIRQNFDAVTVKNGSVPDFEFLYSYIFDVNRSPGTDSPLGIYNTHTNAFHATYTGLPEVKLSAYAYLMNIGNNTTLSNQTEGARAEAKHAFTDTLTGTGVGEYARQSNYGNNTANYSLNYFTVEPGIIIGKDKGSFGSLTGKVGYELLGGNGFQAVQTPEASLHNQNGWADLFNTIPVAGLRDTYVSGAYKYQLPWAELTPTKLQTDWHRFYSDKGDLHYGDELDMDLSQVFHDHYTLELQYADYHADNKLNPNTHKLMLIGMLQY